MPTPLATPHPPTDDKRWRTVDARMRIGGRRPDALIEVLHSVQEAFGYLEVGALEYVSASLGEPPSRVFGVVTFYSYFALKPRGAHVWVVCTGTACYINGASRILARIPKSAGVAPGETTADGRLSVLRARCLGACSMAPAVVVDGSVRGKLTPDDVDALLAALS
jgi:bidirectional [NiFe] hydrogenase diaphorase subunit